MIDWLTLRHPLYDLPQFVRERLQDYVGFVYHMGADGKITWSKLVMDIDKLRSDSPGIFWQFQGGGDGREYLTCLSPSAAADAVYSVSPRAPDGALIVIDECQQFFRPRASSAAVPRAVAELEVHRHRGLDFWLITQHPNLLDQNIRRLITRHVHFRRTWRGREQIEWGECGNPDQPRSRETAARKRVSLPSKAFELYKSAEVHTRVPLAIPRFAFVFAVAAVVSLVLGYYVYRAIDARGGQKQAVSAPVSSPGQPVPVASFSPPPSASASSVKSPAEYAAETLPRISSLPHTAPRYDQITQAKLAPRPAACVYVKATGVCRCYTQQSTPLQVQPDICKDIALNGFFVDWDDSKTAQSSDAPRADSLKNGNVYDGPKRVL